MYIDGKKLSQIIRIVVRRWPDMTLAQIADWVECTPKYTRSVMIGWRIWHPEVADALDAKDTQYYGNLIALWEKCQQSPDLSFRGEMARAVQDRLKKIDPTQARTRA